jgi:hypothetical protein
MVMMTLSVQKSTPVVVPVSTRLVPVCWSLMVTLTLLAANGHHDAVGCWSVIDGHVDSVDSFVARPSGPAA